MRWRIPEIESDQKTGFTLVELLVVIAVVGLLAAVASSGFSTFKKRAEKAKCLSHMRSMHTVFMGYIQDKGHWPQFLESGEERSEENFFGFFIRELEPYGSSQELWLCPSDKVYARIQKNDPDRMRYFGSYVPTSFDKASATPFRFNQPWLVERGDFHGNGGHILMPDGSIQESQNPFFGR